jgi:hypothetical protein
MLENNILFILGFCWYHKYSLIVGDFTKCGNTKFRFPVHGTWWPSMLTVSDSRPDESSIDSSIFPIKLQLYEYGKYHASTVISIPH